MRKGMMIPFMAVLLFMTSCAGVHHKTESDAAKNSVACAAVGSIWEYDSLWYKPLSERDTSLIDVIYLVSTDVLSAQDSLGNAVWQSQLTPADREAITGEIAWVEQNEFYGDFNVIAPLYHQFTFDAIIKLDHEAFDRVYRKVADEACEAFDYYMEKVNNGRPFILAGFSQGAMLTLDVLKHMTDDQFQRMIACYTQGYRITADDLKHPHIQEAEGETDKGVVISFNTVQNTQAMWPFVTEGAAACINPVNWRTDETPAEFTFDGTHNVAHIDTATHQVVVKTDNPPYYYDFYTKVPCFTEASVKKDNLHHWDLLFYGSMIHDNAVKRAQTKGVSKVK